MSVAIWRAFPFADILPLTGTRPIRVWLKQALDGDATR